jgi:hypothetical protein
MKKVLGVLSLAAVVYLCTVIGLTGTEIANALENSSILIRVLTLPIIFCIFLLSVLGMLWGILVIALTNWFWD